jgi:hypothetical protein
LFSNRKAILFFSFAHILIDGLDIKQENASSRFVQGRVLILRTFRVGITFRQQKTDILFSDTLLLSSSFISSSRLALTAFEFIQVQQTT